MGALAWPLLIAIILALVLLFIKGEVTNNAQSWYDFGFFSLQPSEFAKSILIVFMAVFYNKLNYKKTKNIYSYLIPLAAGALIAGLVIMQPDLGSAAIIAGIVFLTFISIPLVKNNMIRFIKIIAIGLVIGSNCITLFWSRFSK